MNATQLIAEDILCLAHTSTKLEWCDRSGSCKRHRDISIRGIVNGVGVLFRCCQPGAHDQFIEAK